MREYIIVDNVIDMHRLYEDLNDNLIFAYDIETTGLKPTKEKVIGFSLCSKVGKAFYIPHLTWNTEKEELVEVNSREKMLEILNILLEKELIMWNGSFDVRFTKYYFGIDLIGSLIADAMLMKHTIEEEGVFSLKGCAILYQEEIGLNVEEEANKEQIALKENIVKNGGSTSKENYEMYKADLDVMGEYAAADADLTLRLALLFRDRLEEQNLVSFFYDEEVMPLYKKVTIPMEDRPVKLDTAKIEKFKKDIEKDISRLKNEILHELLSTPAVKDWLLHTALNKHPIKPSGGFAQKVVERYKLPLPTSASGKYSLSKKNLEKLPDSKYKKFLMKEYRDPVIFNDLSAKIYPDWYKVRNMLIPFKGLGDISIELWSEKNGDPVNISSKKQLGEIVFDYMKIAPLSKTKKGAPQFDDNMIQHLADEGYDWAVKLSDYNKLIKIKSAYMERFLENNIDGGYYFYYKQHGTLSGRYSSDAQQLPRPKEEGELSELVLHYNNAIRSFFIAGEGRTFIDADYESLEPHVFAHVSGDEGLRNIFRKGHDFYSTIAIQTEKLSGVSADKKAENYLKKLDAPRRQKAKAYSLGVPYGMTPYALAKTLGVNEKEAKKLYDGYLDGFPELKKWMDQSKHDAQYKGYVKTQTGRIRHLDKVKELHRKHGEKLLDFRYRKKCMSDLSKKMDKEEAEKKVVGAYLDYKNGINNARNFQIQGLSASIVNRAMIQIMDDFSDQNIDGYVCATVHDQIIVNVSNNDVDKATEIVENRMTTVVKLSVDLKAPPELSNNWRDGH
jgi:DNA polymerase I-like protein with 3'-5' exonuclease and polymerase domains